jgi:hypothetical protein
LTQRLVIRSSLVTGEQNKTKTVLIIEDQVD